MPNWVVDIDDAHGNVIAATTTDSNGFYKFDLSLDPGVYTVTEVVQAGWYSTYPNASGSYSVTVGDSGGEFTGLDFANFQLITVSGAAYNDLDGNGFPARGSPGWKAWNVNLYDSLDNLVAAAITDSNGNFAFTSVPAGSYIVAETVPTNWVQTQPLYPTQYSFQAQSGHNLSALNFGDHSSPALTPTLVIDNGDPGLCGDRHVG